MSSNTSVCLKNPLNSCLTFLAPTTQSLTPSAVAPTAQGLTPSPASSKIPPVEGCKTREELETFTAKKLNEYLYANGYDMVNGAKAKVIDTVMIALFSTSTIPFSFFLWSSTLWFYGSDIFFVEGPEPENEIGDCKTKEEIGRFKPISLQNFLKSRGFTPKFVDGQPVRLSQKKLEDLVYYTLGNFFFLSLSTQFCDFWSSPFWTPPFSFVPLMVLSCSLACGRSPL